ncbi:LysE family translocator [Polycladidibacter stylochi]|uniref:LysE family translocator n=1 Tax=Polycladidibacter stylochi TaxID=1807766 RepID=UPI0008325876|nr:LysE family translocator [Pseudovibrio stylochi]
MLDLLPPTTAMLTFMAAVLTLCLTPGPAVIYISSGSLAHGRTFGMLTALGVAIGNIANAALAILGLAALFALYPPAFTTIKFLGALYMVYLGLTALRKAKSATVNLPTPNQSSLGKIFRDGFIVALLNPKTTIFFAAFLPQFITSTQQATAQSFLLAAVFCVIGFSTDSTYALIAGSIKSTLTKSPQIIGRIQFVSALIFIALGLWLLISA